MDAGIHNAPLTAVIYSIRFYAIRVPLNSIRQAYFRIVSPLVRVINRLAE